MVILRPLRSDCIHQVLPVLGLRRSHIINWVDRKGWVPILSLVHYYILWQQYPFHQFRFKNLEHLLLGSRGNQIKDLIVGATWPGFFTSPLDAFRHDAPALSRVRSHNNGKVGIKSFARTPGVSGLISM